MPIEVRIEALGTERVGMLSSRARRTRSVWVVALGRKRELDRVMLGLFLRPFDVPEWISYDEECDVHFVGVGEDVVA